MSAASPQTIRRRSLDANIWLSPDAADPQYLANLPVRDLVYEVLPSEEAVGRAMLGGPDAGAASHLAYIKPGSGATYTDLAGLIPISASILEHHMALPQKSSGIRFSVHLCVSVVTNSLTKIATETQRTRRMHREINS